MKGLIADNDNKFSTSCFDISENEGIKRMQIAPFSPNLNAFAEYWTRIVKISIQRPDDSNLLHRKSEFKF